jgi:predicted DNA-binding protein
MKEKSEPTERLNINIPAEQYARLRKLNEQTELTITVLVKRALAAYLDSEEAALRKKK